jgi:ribose transport system ATP-binding protein
VAGATREPVLQLTNISKQFGGTVALDGVDFTLCAGEIHGLVGENGAGKSTLMKIIAGIHTQYEGTMCLYGQEIRFHAPRDAIAAGIGMIHQELSVIKQLTVAENVFLGQQPITRLGTVDWRTMVREARKHLEGLGIEMDVRRPLETLSLGWQQMVEIGRVLYSGARIIILDEPTSALSPPEVKRLFAFMRRLSESGTSMVFISHFLDDVLEISDTISVFKNGKKVATVPNQGISKEWVIEQMIGKTSEVLEETYEGEVFLHTPEDGAVVLETQGLSRTGVFNDVSLQVRAGEVVGIYGFMGAGHTELSRALFGKLAPDSGTIRVAGQPRRLRNTTAAKNAGVAYLPESRRSTLFLQEPAYKNVSITFLERISPWLLKRRQEMSIAQEQVERLQVRPPQALRPAGSFSGGNQQKVALAKWLAYPPKVLVLSEPTRGMDVGAKAEVMKIIRDLKTQGVGVVVVSTEPETVMAVADRILVMNKGRVAKEFAREPVSKDRLLSYA